MEFGLEIYKLLSGVVFIQTVISLFLGLYYYYRKVHYSKLINTIKDGASYRNYTKEESGELQEFEAILVAEKGMLNGCVQLFLLGITLVIVFVIFKDTIIQFIIGSRGLGHV